MKRYEHLVNRLNEARVKVGNAKQDLQEYLFPILDALGSPAGVSGLSDVRQEGAFLIVETTGVCRGSTYTDGHKIPLSIFSSADPVVSAVALKKIQDRKNAEYRFQQKVAEISRLQQELLKEPLP